CADGVTYAIGDAIESSVVTWPYRISNILIVCRGDPLANVKRVLSSDRRFVGPAHEGLGMSPRRITISTVGLVPGINKLAAEDIPVTFALSLHAPDDELRDEMIPVNTRWKADEAIDAAYNYFRSPVGA